jgi:hypothetical protein
LIATGKGWSLKMARTVVSAPRAEPDVVGAGQRPPGRPTLSDRLPRAWMFPLLAFAGTWVLILATWYGGDRLYGQSHPWIWHFMYKDATWFLNLAQHGYPPTLIRKTGLPGPATAFFPLFPALVREAGRALGNFEIGGLVVTVLAGTVSALLVWEVAARARDRWVADRAVLLYCFFPGAMAFGIMYSEPVTVALGAGAVLALMNRRWLVAGIIGAAATAEASILLALVAVSGLTALHAIWTRREWRALIAPALTPLGILAFFGYVGHRYHDYAFWFQSEQAYWGQHVDWGAHTVRFLLWNSPDAFKYKFVWSLYVVMLFVIAAGIVMLLAARLALPVSLYGVFLVATFVLSPANPRPRYVICAFPLFIGAAAKLPRALYWPVLVVSAASLVFLIAWWPNHEIGPAP